MSPLMLDRALSCQKKIVLNERVRYFYRKASPSIRLRWFGLLEGDESKEYLIITGKLTLFQFSNTQTSSGWTSHFNGYPHIQVNQGNGSSDHLNISLEYYSKVNNLMQISILYFYVLVNVSSLIGKVSLKLKAIG